MPIWLQILLGLLALLFLLLLEPVRIRIRAGETFSLTVRYLFFTFSPAFGGEAIEKAAKLTPKKVKKEVPEKAAFRLGVSIEEILDAIAAVWPPVRRLIRSIRIDDLMLHITVGGRDAADAALTYGRLCGYVSSGYALLLNMFGAVRVRSIVIEPDFLAEHTRYDLDATLGLRPIRLLGATASVTVKAFPLLWKILFPKKEKQAPAKVGV